MLSWLSHATQATIKKTRSCSISLVLTGDSSDLLSLERTLKLKKKMNFLKDLIHEGLKAEGLELTIS